MSSTLIQGSQKAPYTSTLGHEVAMQLAMTEYERVATTLEQLTPAQWASGTDCPGWDCAIAGHVLGIAQMAASMREMMRQQLRTKRRAARGGGLMIDALTALQVEKNATLGTGDIVAPMRIYGPRAGRGRARTRGLSAIRPACRRWTAFRSGGPSGS